VHHELPKNADAYTHRAGRTGRAGRKGTSTMLVPPGGIAHVTRLMRAVGVKHRFEPVPTPGEIRAAADERLVEALTGPDAGTGDAVRRFGALAARLVEGGDPAETIARLLARTQLGAEAEAREVRVIEAPARTRKDDKRAGRDPRDRGRGGPRDEGRNGRTFGRDQGRDDARGPARDAGRDRGEPRNYVSFSVRWGEEYGADARRVLAMVCRRGLIRGSDVGAIRVGPKFSIVDVAENVARDFEKASARPDPRDPMVTIRRDTRGSANGYGRPPQRAEGARSDDRGRDERPPRRNDGPRPPRRSDDERPTKRTFGTRPAKRDDDPRPPRRSDDERPPARANGARPPTRRGGPPPERRTDDAPTPEQREGRRPPKRKLGGAPPKRKWG